MGYYANWGGTIKFKEKPSKEIFDKIDDCFHIYWDKDEYIIHVGSDEKYHHEEAEKVLKMIEPITKSGEIEFAGEDNVRWRFIFKDGKWVEESGYVYYESELSEAQKNQDEFLGRIMDVIQDCLDNPRGEIIEGEWYDETIDELDAIMRAWKVF